MKRFISTLAAAFSLAASGASHAAAPELAMYRLDCGHMTLGDKSVLSDAGMYKGQSYDIVISCYLIRHGADWLLWDAGLPRKYLGGPRTEGSFTTRLERPIVDQIAELGLRPADIKYVAVSHAHFDHAGQLGDFPNATLIIQRAEVDAIADTGKASEHYIEAELFGAHLAGGRRERVKVLDGDADLFGDGSLRAIHTPGHTPGSMALLVGLKRAGAYVLSGDQWHITDSHQHRQVPTWNYDHDQTLASGKKLDDIIAGTRATLVIQHEPVDNAKLPAWPRFLD